MKQSGMRRVAAGQRRSLAIDVEETLTAAAPPQQRDSPPITGFAVLGRLLRWRMLRLSFGNGSLLFFHTLLLHTLLPLQVFQNTLFGASNRPREGNLGQVVQVQTGNQFFVRVCSRHRAAAFEASAWIVEELKKRAPIWKHVRFSSGAEATSAAA